MQMHVLGGNIKSQLLNLCFDPWKFCVGVKDLQVN
jgi:hypothetical protein